VTREVKTGSAVIDQFPAFEDDGVSKRAGLLPGDFTPTVYRNGDVAALAVTISPSTDPGEYKTSFIPSSSGFHELQVLVHFNGEIRFARYEVVDKLTRELATEARDQANKIDVAGMTLPPASGSLVDHLTNKDGSQTYNPATDSLEALADALSTGNTSITNTLTLMQADLKRVLGLLHHNSMLDKQTYDGLGQLTSARLRVFDSAANVPSAPDGNETLGLLHEYDLASEWSGQNINTKFTLKRVL
jgi:hypothetical protein